MKRFNVGAFEKYRSVYISFTKVLFIGKLVQRNKNKLK